MSLHIYYLVFYELLSYQCIVYKKSMILLLFTLPFVFIYSLLCCFLFTDSVFVFVPLLRCKRI